MSYRRHTKLFPSHMYSTYIHTHNSVRGTTLLKPLDEVSIYMYDVYLFPYHIYTAHYLCNTPRTHTHHAHAHTHTHS